MATDNTTKITQDQHVDTRDFRCISCSIIASDGTSTEVKSSVAEVMVRQDMFLGLMSGELLLTDGNDLIARMGIHGGEYMFLHFTVPEQDIELKKAFRIYKVGDRAPSDSSQKYTIKFVSDEMFISNTKRISKGYPSTTVADMARDILLNWLDVPQKKVFVDATAGSSSTIIPNLRPIEALNWLATRAYNASGSSCFFFYEDTEGFHFASLNQMYKRGTRIKVPFTLDNKRGERELDMDKFAIDDYRVVKDFDALSTSSSGGYAMSLTTMDPLTRAVAKSSYSVNGMDKMYDNNPMGNAGELLEKTDARPMFYMHAEGLDKRVSNIQVISNLNSSLTEITVPGNMGLLVGTMVNIRIPYTVTPATGDMWDKQKSGRYLATVVNHKFDMVNQKFTSLVWLARDSQPESLPASDTTLPDKIKRLNNG